MIIKLELEYSVDEALEYYQELENKFQKLKWHYERDHNDTVAIDPKNNMNDYEGWGLQTIYSDIWFPYHCDIDPHDEGPEYFKDTPLVFGFVEKLFKKFKQTYRSFLIVDSPKSYIAKWKSGNRDHFKVCVPIICNSQTFARSYTETIQKEQLIAGSIYIVLSEVDMEYINDGDTRNVYIVFNVPSQYLNEVLEYKGKL